MYYCAYSGSFGEFACNPRTLSSLHLNRMISLEGIVTKCSLVRPKVVKSVHWNEKEHQFVFREYQDQTMSANGPASMSVYPQSDEKGNPVSTHDICINALLISLLAYHRIWLLHVSRSPDNLDPRNARTGASWSAASRCRCHS